jgi:hypothetical protein
MIDDYFLNFSESLAYLDIITSHSLTKKKIDDYSGIIRGRICFGKFSLDVLEVVFLFNNPQVKKKKYSYHFMDSNSVLIFRYDNAMHHKELSSFPHHKHLKNEVVASSEPNINTILREIKSYLERQ